MADCHVVRPRRGWIALLQFASFILLIPALCGSSRAQTIQGPDVTNPAYSPGPIENGKPTGDYYPWGQCTWYAWGRAKESDNYSLQHYGNAKDWAAGVNSQTPMAHSIAVWQNSIKGNGHVAYVEKVDGDNLWITEANFSNFRPGVDDKKDDIGGGFDGCHILTKKQMARRGASKEDGDLILKGYITYPATASPTAATLTHNCTRGKALSIDKDHGFSFTQTGDQVTITFKGSGFAQGAKVIAQGVGWSSDEVVVTSNNVQELVAILGVQDAATFTVAIQNPDMERSKPQELSVTAAPAAPVSNLQPVPAQEPVSTPATAPDVSASAGALMIPSEQPPAQEAAPVAEAAPETSPAETARAEQSTDAQPLTIPSTPQPASDPSAAQSQDSSVASQATNQAVAPTADQTTAPPADQPSAEAPASAAPTTAAVSLPPVLLRVSPGQHAPGQFTVDLWGLNFQQGAKMIAQGNGWSSDQAAVTFIDSTHLQAVIVAQNSAQFTLAIQNPDAQTSSARGFVVVQPPSAAAASGSAPATAPVTTTNAPVLPATSAFPSPSATGSVPPASAAAPISAPSAATTAAVTAPAPAAPATTNPTTTTAQAVTPISAPPAAVSVSAPTSATSATKNPVSAPTATRVPISPLLPRGGTTNAGSTIPIAPISAPGALTAKSPIVRPPPVSAVATSLTSGATQQGLSFCGRSIVPLPTQDIPTGTDCGKYLEGQCVAYARCRSGYNGSLPGGDARNWPINQPDKQKVQSGDVVIFTSGEFGHVAYVESVNRDASARVIGVTVSEANYGGKLDGFPNLSACGATKKYGIVDTRTVSIDSFQGVYHPGSAPGQILPPVNSGSPILRVSAASSLKSGDSIDLMGENFTRNSRVSLLLTAPGAAETFLVSFTSDANGGFHYPYNAACDAKSGAYSIRALDQAPAGSGITGRKSNSLALTVAGKASHCLLGINAAVASGAPASGPPPVLKPVTPASHPAGRFSVDLYGSGFQPGAKLIAQGNGWSSDQAAVIYVGPDHLRAVVDAPNPAQFTLAVKNPDSQVSAAYPFQVTAAITSVTTKSGQASIPAHTPVPGSAAPSPGGVSANAGSTVPSAQSTQIPIKAIPLSTPTPARQSATINSTPTQPRPVTPVVAGPRIQPMPTPPQTIKPMPTPQPNVAAYPANNTSKPVLRPPSPNHTVPAQAPVSTVPMAPGIKPVSPPSTVTTVHPAPTPPRPAATPILRAQPLPATPPVRVAPTPTPVQRVYTPPPPPRVAPQPTPIPQATKTPTPKKP